MTRPDLRYVRQAAKSTVREALWYVTSTHRQGPKRNILLFATRRGGSTFAMELIAANRGIRSLDQPLEFQGQVTAAQIAALPRFHQGQITSLDDEFDRRLRSLMSDIFAGEVVINAPTRVWRRDATWRSDRLVLKITDAKPVIGWFDEHFDVDIVYLTRHPIPQALSCIRNRWTLTVDAHLRDERFVTDHLSDRAVDVARRVMRGDDVLEQFVLNWALENVAPLRLLPTKPAWTHVRYEDCVSDPDGTLDQLAERLQLDDVERMRKLVNRPSVSSTISTSDTRAGIAAGRGAETLDRWRSEVDAEAERRCLDLLEVFEIDPAVVFGP